VLGAVAGGGACLASGQRRGHPVAGLLGFAIVGGLWLLAGVVVFAGIEVSNCIAD
jgi:hypothetical protein